EDVGVWAVATSALPAQTCAVIQAAAARPGMLFILPSRNRSFFAQREGNLPQGMGAGKEKPHSSGPASARRRASERSDAHEIDEIPRSEPRGGPCRPRLFVADPLHEARLEHVEREGTRGQDCVVKATHVEGGAEVPLRALAQLEDFQLADFVRQRL